MNNDYIFETEHLAVRKFVPEDAVHLYENHKDDEVKKWIPGECYEDLNEARECAYFFAECVQNNRLPYVLAVVLKETGELVGDTGINEVEGKPDEVEIGFVIGSRYRGRGYATEILKHMTDHAASHFGFKVIYGRVMKGNEASVRVLEKNGYSFESVEYGAEDDPYGNGMMVYKTENIPAHNDER
ncbi:MAG: GNAT family N-acetyltransferase [Lachnospiraceae bacterium]|nr:GNAT family N-acetyltransferase [Lachnospiraceae bacterium]